MSNIEQFGDNLVIIIGVPSAHKDPIMQKYIPCT